MTKKSTLFSGGKVIDGTGSPSIDADVFITEDKIVSVGSDARKMASQEHDFAEIDISGCTVLPGLIDSHCHISFDQPSTNDELFFHRRHGLATLVASVNAQKVLRSGVTGFFDADCIFDVGVDLRDAIEGGVVPGPRMATGGNVLINCVGGTAAQLLPDEGRRGYGVIVHTPDQIITEIHRQVKKGVDWIKVHVSGLPVRPGATEGEIQTWSLDELKLVCDTAHGLGIPVVGHCRNASSTRDAARAGFDMILHATYMDQEALESVIDAMVPIVPTFTFQANLADYGDLIGSDPRYKEIFRKEIVDSVDTIKKAYQAGVPLLTGSESGFSITPYGEWHHRELEIFVNELGLTPVQAIQCATSNGARSLRLEDKLGKLEPGYLADLLVVKGDPSQDISLLGKSEVVKHIFKGGREVDLGLPLPETWNLPAWRVNEFSSQVLTRKLARSGGD